MTLTNTRHRPPVPTISAADLRRMAGELRPPKYAHAVFRRADGSAQMIEVERVADVKVVPTQSLTAAQWFAQLAFGRRPEPLVYVVDVAGVKHGPFTQAVYFADCGYLPQTGLYWTREES